ncbi:MAG TPA: LLM class flavin-dependent oxidoreductase [Xanthobacteraceae bacterium]|jgi:alkanesulfonate monooxygenase SsuD/methylene tetrahydromethanopterin reductase-like flavin-dependent oxidoreductase (luciferase family)
MRLGMFMMPVHPPDRTFWSTLEEDAEKSVLADRLGFDEVWLGEHFSATTEPIPSPLMFFAGLIQRTTNVAFGTAVINLPNHHPAIVAAEAAQFDHMSKGRLMLGVGPGGLVSDFELFGNPDVHARNRMVVEAVDFITRIWSQDPPYELEGEFWSIAIKNGIVPELGVGYMPKPYQPGGPPISISLASPNSPSAATAARKRWGMISANIIPTYSVASHWRVYSEACAAAGIAPRGDSWRVARNVLVAPSDAEAQERVFGEEGSNRYFYTYMREVLSRVGLLVILKPRPDMADEAASVEAITRECVIYGSPRTVLDKLVAFRDEVGPFGTLLMTGLDWGGRNAAWEHESMRLLAQQVMPGFRQHVTARAAE